MVKAGEERFSGSNLETVVPAELPWEQSWWSTGNAHRKLGIAPSSSQIWLWFVAM